MTDLEKIKIFCQKRINELDTSINTIDTQMPIPYLVSCVARGRKESFEAILNHITEMEMDLLEKQREIILPPLEK